MSNPKLANYTLIHGLQNNDLKSVEISLESGAKPQSVSLKKAKTMDSDDDDNWYDRRDAKQKPLPAFDFAMLYCSQEIVATLQSKLRTEATLLQSIAYAIKHAKPNRFQLIRTHVNSKNVNDYFPMQHLAKARSHNYYRNDDDKAHQATLLHVACGALDKEVITLLLEFGANPNQKLDKTKQTPAELVVEQTPSNGHGDQMPGTLCLKALLMKDANFNLKCVKDSGSYRTNTKGKIWQLLISYFKIPELRILLKDYSPKDLSAIHEVQVRSKTLYDYWLKNHPRQYSKYPLLNDIRQYENRKVSFAGNFSLIENFEDFFKHSKIKDALFERYKLNSGAFTKAFMDQLFNKHGNSASVQVSCFYKADFLKEIFLKSKKPNHAFFLEAFNNKDAYYFVPEDDNKEIKTQTKLLKGLFNEQQIKTLLTSSDNNRDDDNFEDTLDMLITGEHRKILQERVQNRDFKYIKTIAKLHDFLVAESEVLDNEDFPLNQGKHFPETNKLKDVQFTGGFGLKVAETKHELIRWGSLMGHCIGTANYGEEASNGECILIAITEGEMKDPVYAIEIGSNKELRQVQGYSRVQPPLPLMQEVVEALQKHKVLNKKPTNAATRWSRKV